MSKKTKKPRPKKEEGIDWGLWIILGLIAILILKGFGVLQLWFNIDPEGFTLNIDVGYLTSGALFIYVLTRLHKLNDVLSKQGERVARIEGLLEKK
jgi:hypothetical protein